MRYSVSPGCNGCRLCEYLALNNFGQLAGEGRYVVVKQPETWEEEEQCLEALERCHRQVIRREMVSGMRWSHTSFDGVPS